MSAMTDTVSQPLSRSPRAAKWLKPIAFASTVAVVIGLTTQYGSELSLEKLARQETALRQLVIDHPWPVYGGAFLLYVIVMGLSLPGAGLLSLVYGWLFKFWPALVIVSFGSTIGATMAFLMSRYFFRDLIQSYLGDRLVKFNEALRRDGAFYLFTLRLIPGIPYFVVNAVMGLTPIRTWTFYWVSQLGWLGGSAALVYAGASVGSLEELARKGPAGLIHPQTILVFVLVGVFSLVAKVVINVIQSRRANAADSPQIPS